MVESGQKFRLRTMKTKWSNRKAFGNQKIYKKIRMVENGRILKGVPGIMIDNDQNKPNFP